MQHASDCPTHNMPAMPNQHCDCGADLKHNVVLMDRIAELEALLRRIDNVTLWETHPLGRCFQQEIEAALGVGEKPIR